MQRFWLKNYPDDIPHDINVSDYESVAQIFNEAIIEFGDRTAFSNYGDSISYSQLGQKSHQLALFLQNELNLSKGDRLAIMLPNLIQYPVAVIAAVKLGLVIINIDPQFTKRELVQQLNDSQTETLLLLENQAALVADCASQTSLNQVIVTRFGDCFSPLKGLLYNAYLRHVKRMVPKYHFDIPVTYLKSAIRSVQRGSFKLDLPMVNHSDLLFLQYTGGTTGVPKGVELTHGNIIANFLQARVWLRGALSDEDDAVIAPLPMYHIFCMTANCMVMMNLGCRNVLVTNPKDYKGFVKLLSKTHFTAIVGVNTLFRKLLDTPGFSDLDFGKLKFAFAGGMAVTHDVAEQWMKVTGTSVIEAYGLSEASPAVAINRMDIKGYTGNIGLPLPSTDIKILDNDNKEMGIGEEGELCIKGPQVTRGYWHNPQESEQAFTEDGYFRTGDYAAIDEFGHLRLLDRKKDMILVSGFNVFPTEIENIVNQHTNVIESAVIGVDDETTGQFVKLFVVSNTPTLDTQTLKDYCESQLTGYKRPKQIVFIDELPKTHVGKILRKELQ